MRSLKELLEKKEIPTLEEARVYGAVGNDEEAHITLKQMILETRGFSV